MEGEIAEDLGSWALLKAIFFVPSLGKETFCATENRARGVFPENEGWKWRISERLP